MIGDLTVSAGDVQQLGTADAVAAFFARLGYQTNARTPQTPANLGVTSEGIARPIRRIELIADHEGLQVYLFEVSSVTLTHARALGRSFRNRAGNYLLVLTSDYERLDFVLLERYLAPTSHDALGINTPQAGIRPRVLTVDRRNPSRVDLRVLRRFVYVASDGYGQYERLRAAYDIADWSENFFNNRALFSDYYLLERLRDDPAWAEDPKPAFLRLREIFRAASSTSGQPEELLRRQIVEPTLEVLGFQLRAGKRAGSEMIEPDYLLSAGTRPDYAPAACLAYAWGRSLDGKDEQRDRESPEENPGAVVVSLLEKGKVPWVIVTNGKQWRLHAAKAHSRATNYYEVDLEEALAESAAEGSDPAEAFRYFWLFFRRQAFEPTPVARGGATHTLSFLDLVLADSEDYAKELGDRLKNRVFIQTFPYLVEGFITFIRQRDGLHADLSQDRLDEIYQGTLTLLYRLLFLLYAEARDLLPVKELRGYWEASLAKLKRGIADAAGAIVDEDEGRLRRQFSHRNYELYDRLVRLFEIIDQGDPDLNVPTYNGGLFISRPDAEDDSPEGTNARFLHAHKVPDYYLARSLDLLARDEDSKRHDLVAIDYKSLGVRHLGSIYEGLLEFKVRIADRRLAVVKEKSREVYVPAADLSEQQRERAERQGRIVGKGQVYLENDRRERKATGSYYTPDYIVKYIVEHTVGPVLQQKFEAMRSKLRDAQRRRQEFFKRQEGLRKVGIRPEPPEKADLIGQELVPELFDLKVLDPAMGSGHFLVEAVDLITDKTVHFLNAFPWNPVFAELDRTRKTILKEMMERGISIDERRLTDVNLLKRHILKRCIYGVDLNPMAVELAKVSLWLDCFTLGAPLSFLDHHLKCGNSLVGAGLKTVREAAEQDLFGAQFAGLLQATQGMIRVGELSDVTFTQVKESARAFRDASVILEPFKEVLDLWTSQHFGNAEARSLFLSGAFPEIRQGWQTRLGPTGQPIAARARRTAAESRFFHWELDFPEVYFRKDSNRKSMGFDAVVGNPPWGARLNSRTLAFCRNDFEAARKGVVDTFAVFIEQGLRQLRPEGNECLLLPDIVLLKNHPAIRKFLLDHTTLLKIVHWGMPFPDVNLDVCSILVHKRVPEADHAVECTSDLRSQSPESGFRRSIRQATFREQEGFRFNIYLDSDLEGRLRKARELGPPLGSVFRIHEGIHSGNIREKLFLHEKSSALCRPLIFGRDEVQAFHATWKGRYVNYDPQIIDRAKGEYANLGNKEEYDRSKILVRRTGDTVIAAYDSRGFCVSNNLFYCLPKERLADDDLFYVLGILNSGFATWFFRSIQPRKGRLFAELKINHLREIPLPLMNELNRHFRVEIAEFVREELCPKAKAAQLAQSDIAALDRKLRQGFRW